MIQVTHTGLQINIEETSPMERRNSLIKAIAASIRWNGTCENSEKYTHDGENLIVLAQLLENLIDEGE